MESAKQLTQLIHDYRTNAIIGGFPGDDVIGKQIEADTLSDPDAPQLAKFLCSMGGKGGAGIAAMARVWEYQDQIVAYQKANNISSVLWEELDWKGEKVRFPITHSDLQLMPQDRAVLSRWKWYTAEKFLEFVTRHHLYGDLYRIDYEEEGEVEVPVTLADIRIDVRHFDHAMLSGGRETPVYLARETGTSDRLTVSKEICYHLTEFSLWLDEFPSDYEPEPDGLHFAVKIRRYS
jgi:hypothetical protein